MGRKLLVKVSCRKVLGEVHWALALGMEEWGLV